MNVSHLEKAYIEERKSDEFIRKIDIENAISCLKKSKDDKDLSIDELQFKVNKIANNNDIALAKLFNLLKDNKIENNKSLLFNQNPAIEIKDSIYTNITNDRIFNSASSLNPNSELPNPVLDLVDELSQQNQELKGCVFLLLKDLESTKDENALLKEKLSKLLHNNHNFKRETIGGFVYPKEIDNYSGMLNQHGIGKTFGIKMDANFKEDSLNANHILSNIGENKEDKLSNLDNEITTNASHQKNFPEEIDENEHDNFFYSSSPIILAPLEMPKFDLRFDQS
ncbi:unnamed protein product [Gordionus sp. m RMFG-2023]